MEHSIETRFIFLDTSVFYRDNFAGGMKIKSFFERHFNGEIELICTDFSKQEVLKKYKEKVAATTKTLETQLKNINSLSRGLESDSSALLNKAEKIIENEPYEDELIAFYSSQWLDKMKVVKPVNDILNKITIDYFRSAPPFANQKKKNEFPDAIILNTLESWAMETNEKIYVVSHDGDFHQYKSESLIPITDDAELLDLITKVYSEENVLNEIESTLKHWKSELENAAQEFFESNFPQSGVDINYGCEFDTLDIVVSNVEKRDVAILNIQGESVSAEVEMTLSYDALINVGDLNMGTYDKEDDIWYGVEEKQINIKEDVLLKLDMEFYLDMTKVVTPTWALIDVKGVPKKVEIPNGAI